MVLNIPKTESMLMGNVQRLRNAMDSFSIGEDEFTITVVNTHKLLGMHVDSSLTWDSLCTYNMFHNLIHINSSFRVYK